MQGRGGWVGGPAVDKCSCKAGRQLQVVSSVACNWTAALVPGFVQHQNMFQGSCVQRVTDSAWHEASDHGAEARQVCCQAIMASAYLFSLQREKLCVCRKAVKRTVLYVFPLAYAWGSIAHLPCL